MQAQTALFSFEKSFVKRGGASDRRGSNSRYGAGAGTSRGEPIAILMKQPIRHPIVYSSIVSPILKK